MALARFQMDRLLHAFDLCGVESRSVFYHPGALCHWWFLHLALDLWPQTMILKTEYLLAIVLFLLLVERIFSYMIHLSSRKDIEMLRDEFSQMRSEFVKLASLLQAFLMNVKFNQAGQPESKLKSTDTQVMVSAIELERLRDAERLMREESVERLLRRRTHGDSSGDDDLGEIIQ